MLQSKQFELQPSEVHKVAKDARKSLPTCDLNLASDSLLPLLEARLQPLADIKAGTSPLTRLDRLTRLGRAETQLLISQSILERSGSPAGHQKMSVLRKHQ
jgi:hypothetical protein